MIDVAFSQYYTEVLGDSTYGDYTDAYAMLPSAGCVMHSFKATTNAPVVEIIGISNGFTDGYKDGGDVAFSVLVVKK